MFNKYLLLIVILFIAGLFLGEALTGYLVKRTIKDGGSGDTNLVCIDNDRDGYSSLFSCSKIIDCDDNNPAVHPGAIEICGNNLDDDCLSGDIGLCSGESFIQTSKKVFYLNEEVKLK